MWVQAVIELSKASESVGRRVPQLREVSGANHSAIACIEVDTVKRHSLLIWKQHWL
jgi:hypothetical protein